MLFSSPVFLFIFLLGLSILYWLTPGIKLKNVLLLLTSLLFYAWGEILVVFLMIFSVFINYLLALWIDWADKSERPRSRKGGLWITVIFNIGMLGVFKYAAFFIESLNAVSGLDISVPMIGLPIGISFFTFQAMSYVIDIYRKSTPVQKNFPNLLLYISLFPQLIAGPIIKYHDVAEQINERKVTVESLANGIRRFIIGLSKKVLIANTLGQLAKSVFELAPSSLNITLAWVGAISYCVQIYFDFSGYSDMAIGLGQMFGFDFMENFNFPYISKSIKEFWRRWHISLSSWFREYLYIPLGGNRKGLVRQGINMGIVFLCTGLWHGAQWTFVIWGIFHGFFLILETYKVLKPDKWFRPFRHIYTLLVVSVGFTIFNATSMSHAFSFIKEMFTGFKFEAIHASLFGELISPSKLTAIIFAIIASTPIVKFTHNNLIKNGNTKLFSILNASTYVVTIILLVLCILTLSASTFNPFIYFRF